jgi:hypothetical protein
MDRPCVCVCVCVLVDGWLAGRWDTEIVLKSGTSVLRKAVPVKTDFKKPIWSPRMQGPFCPWPWSSPSDYPSSVSVKHQDHHSPNRGTIVGFQSCCTPCTRCNWGDLWLCQWVLEPIKIWWQLHYFWVRYFFKEYPRLERQLVWTDAFSYTQRILFTAMSWSWADYKRTHHCD